MALSGNQGDKRVWPSLNLASNIANIANVAFISSLVIGVVSTVLIVLISNQKEYWWNIDREQSRERIAKLELDVANANARAEAEILARVKIETKLAPRTLTSQQQKAISNSPKPWVGQKVSFSVSEEPESNNLLNQIRSALISAGWVPINAQTGDIRINGAGSVVATGISVQVRPDEARGLTVIAHPPLMRSPLDTVTAESVHAYG